MKIVVIGAGFVGLTTGLGLCSKGHEVVCVDVNPARCAGLLQGQVAFFEPGVSELLAACLQTGRLHATANLAEAMVGADVSMICVGTPSTDKGIDLSYVQAAATEIGAHLGVAADFHVVTVKSTVVPGSVDTAVRATLERTTGKKAGTDFGVAMNPEFLREGCAVEDFMQPDRIVLGADDSRSASVLQQMYAGFDCPVIVTTTRNAEMIKYASNALLATLISYANEITTICESVPGLSEEVVMGGMFEDKRLWCAAEGKRLRPGIVTYLRGGIGFGGSCFPKDVKALLKFANNQGYAAPLLQAVLDINDERSEAVVQRLAAENGGSLTGKTVAMVGVAFKPDTDDIRESPALRLMSALHTAGANVVMHDPVVQEHEARAASGVPLTRFKDLRSALAAADGGAVIATSWAEYKTADWPTLAKEMPNPVIYDGRQVIPAAQRGHGFSYLQSGSQEVVKA